MVKTTKKLLVKKNPWQRLTARAKELLARRPHRSFRPTKRRDYGRSLKLPGYWAFTNQVRMLFVRHKKLFVKMTLLYATLTVVFVGIASQDSYTLLADTLRETGGELFTGGWGNVGQASLLLLTGMSGNLSGTLTEVQQVYTLLLFMLTWLTSVWLSRAVMGGSKPMLRDGLYSAGAPLVSTFVVLLVAVVQLLPLGLALVGFSAAVGSGMIDGGGVESMLIWAAFIGLFALSLYWLTSTLIALVVVTLPGMYPMKAIKVAGDMVIGRRMRILLRLIWAALIALIGWAVIMVPVILLDTWIKGVWPSTAWVPVVPGALLVMMSISVVWIAGYTYVLYRKVVDDDAAPA
jgi:hypothetical protein